MATTDIALERPLPQNRDAERAILGAILLDSHALNSAVEHLRPEDFFLDQHRRIFERMIELTEAQHAIDLVTLSEELSRRGELESAGGIGYLAQLSDGVARVTNVEHYARIVKDKSILRSLIYASINIQQRALDAESDADTFRLAEDRAHTGFVGVKQLVRDNFERLEKIFSEGRHITGLATQYSQLDNEMAGLQNSELIIVAARPSMGKTSLALNIAENIALNQGLPVAVFSLEMQKEALLLRLLASQARVNAHHFRTGRLSKDEWVKISAALSRVADAPLWIDDSASCTVLEMAAKLRRLKREHNVAFVVVDYLQLIASRGRFSNRNEEVSSISRALKGLAKELRVPVMVLSQLTRAPEKEDRKPQLADLRESGAIEQDADVVLFIHRPNIYKKDQPEEERAKTELIIAKQRNGPTGILKFVFLEKHTRFEEAAPDQWDA
jgi:replicative DNA helicase